MTQVQKTPPRVLFTCQDRHPVCHIHDLHRESAGGAHIVECRCCATAEHPSFNLAWAHSRQQHGLQPTTTAVEEWLPSNVLQLKLFAAGRA